MRKGLPPRQYPAQPPEGPQSDGESLQLSGMWKELPGPVWAEEAPLPQRSGELHKSPAVREGREVLHVSYCYCELSEV